MIRNPRLPMLPGYVPNPMIGRTNFSLRPLFTVVDGVKMLVDKAEGVNRVPSLYARKQAADLSDWIVYDKTILHFKAYFQQTLSEMRRSHIVRKVDIYFYPEDGTIKVMEPKVDNSGLDTGILISRQKIRLPYSYDLYHDVIDLNVGKEVIFYGKIFKIVDCDHFTRVYLNKLGIHVSDPLPYPDSVKKPAPIHKEPKHFPFKQFLELDRHVLRFFGYWDDRDSQFGFIHYLEVYYYLSDDTIEIKEVIPRGNGVESGPIFLKRCYLPLKTEPYVTMTHEPRPPSYKPQDLSIGSVLNVYGRNVILADCDAYTKEYYRATYGIDSMSPLKPPQNDCQESTTMNMTKKELPPWNGYGSYEDSAQNCRDSMKANALQSGFTKWLQKDKFGYNSHILRFAARLISNNPEDIRRYFIVKYMLVDDTISVFELSERNSGYSSGRFFHSQKVYLPNVEFYTSDEPPSYSDQDMWVGNELVINNHRFRLVGADEYALRYMELHADEYPKANIKLIMDKIRNALMSQNNGYKNFVAKYMGVVLPNDKNHMTVQCFKQALKEIMCENMTEHEFITLIRYFRVKIGQEKTPHQKKIRSLVFSSLSRGLWDDHDRLRKSLLHLDEQNSGKLPIQKLRQILRANRLPLSDDLMQCMLNLFKRDDNNLIDWRELLDFLDFHTGPVFNLTDEGYKKVVRHTPTLRDTECTQWMESDMEIKTGIINWSAFLYELDLERSIVQD